MIVDQLNDLATQFLKAFFFIVNENMTLTDLEKERQKTYWIRKI